MKPKAIKKFHRSTGTLYYYSPTLGPARMEAAWPPDSENRNRVSVGMLVNRLVRVGRNRVR